MLTDWHIMHKKNGVQPFECRHSTKKKKWSADRSLESNRYKLSKGLKLKFYIGQLLLNNFNSNVYYTNL